jgi:hypothetical protein
MNAPNLGTRDLGARLPVLVVRVVRVVAAEVLQPDLLRHLRSRRRGHTGARTHGFDGASMAGEREKV